MANKKYIKPALTIEQQIEFLISQGLRVSNPELAHHVLSTVSYYRLSSYLLPFKLPHQNNSPRKFKSTATFEQVWQLYQFDRELRLLVVDAIEKIEVAFRAALISVTSVRFHPFWYTDPIYFKRNNKNKKRDFFTDYLKTITDICQSKQEVFIQHYYHTYTEPAFPPIWMIIEALSFGSCSKMFDNIQSKEVRNEIAQVLGQHTTLIESWMRTLTYTRNLCAHHSRLWNRWWVIPPLVPKDSGITSHIEGNYRFQLIAYIIHKILEKISPKSEWRHELFALFERYENFPGTAMGFKANWRKDAIWLI